MYDLRKVLREHLGQLQNFKFWDDSMIDDSFFRRFDVDGNGQFRQPVCPMTRLLRRLTVHGPSICLRAFGQPPLSFRPMRKSLW